MSIGYGQTLLMLLIDRENSLVTPSRDNNTLYRHALYLTPYALYLNSRLILRLSFSCLCSNSDDNLAMFWLSS